LVISLQIAGSSTLMSAFAIAGGALLMSQLLDPLGRHVINQKVQLTAVDWACFAVLLIRTISMTT
jgi:hypothetical protein